MKGAFLLAFLLAASSPDDISSSARSVLAKDSYRFCHDPRYPLSVDDHAWCATLKENVGVCPALLEACKSPPSAGAPGSRRGEPGGPTGESTGENGSGDSAREDHSGDPNGAAKSEGERSKEAEKARREQEERRIREREERREKLPVIGGFGRILFFILVGALVIAIARAIWQNVLQGRDDDDTKTPEKPAQAEAKIVEAAPRGPVETDVARLLARARASAGRGEYAKAIDDAYAALLRRLDGDGLIDIHPSRTNGDYLRAVREKPDLKKAMREILTEVERAQFGVKAPSEASFRAVFDRVTQLVARAAAVVFFVIGLSAMLSCGSPRAAAGDRGSASLQGGTAPSGAKALIEVLEKSGLQAKYRTRGEGVLSGTGTLVLLPGAEIDAAEWIRIRQWVNEGNGSVVVAGASLPDNANVPRVVGDAEGSGAVLVGKDFRSSVTVATVAVPAYQAIELEGYTEADILLERDGRPYAVRAPVIAYEQDEGGEIFVFADDRLFSNVALSIPHNAVFVVRFFEMLPPNIELVDAFSTAGAANPYESVANAKLLPVILQLMALVLLFLFWKGRAFADLRDPPARSRRAFADHARALGLAYARARASHHALGLYASWALERLRERVHRTGRRGMIPLAEAIAARTGRREGEVMQVLMEVTGAREEVSPGSVRSGHRGEGSGLLRSSLKRAAIARDMELMRELEGYLAAVGVSSGRHRRGKRRERAPDSGDAKK